jgi:phage terminase large subunit
VKSQLHGKNLTYNIDAVKASLESYKAYRQGYRFIVNQGGSRSGKTFNLIKLLIGLSLKEKLATSVCSLSFPHLRRGAMRDWRLIMENSDLYNESDHRKTEQLYTFPSGSYMEFFSVDNALKVRGPGRDNLFINEANLIDQDTFEQLNLRTRKAVFLDYNPADEFSWIYDRILTQPDCYFIQTSYKDNPFLPIEQVKQIENLKYVDENMWKVYGLGERGKAEGLIYTHWAPYTYDVQGNRSWGLDFGYNHPAALVKTTERDKDLYSEEVIYESHLTTPELIERVKNFVPRGDTVYCDSANPDKIVELKKAGISAVPADKNVKDGILFLKSRKWYVKGVNAQKELKSYKYKTVNEKLTEEPIKINDDWCDAARYSVTGLRKPRTGTTKAKVYG